MNGVEGVPLKMAIGAQQEEVELIVAPDITVPDYLTILRDTEYEFSLERWVLTSLQGGYPSHPRARALCHLSERPPSCPPYWQMFSSPQQSRLASRHRSDFWEPNPRQRSHSLDPKDLKLRFSASDDSEEDEGEGGGASDGGGTEEKAKRTREKSPLVRQGRARNPPPRPFTPDLLNPPACLSSLPHQRRKNLRQSSLSVLPTPPGGATPGSEKQNNIGPAGPPRQPKTPQRPPTNTRANAVNRPPNVRANTINRVPKTKKHKPSPLTHSQSVSLPLDPSVELLSALSPEERELLGAITEQGYPLRTAILALQKTGQQTPEKILNYLMSCDHLCGRGYDQAQVEEALEMFQNCETKAEEFLHLLAQFIEMGFQQNTIKEVLLVHENHRERALEELMARVA